MIKMSHQTGSIYERELKSLLSGHSKTIEKMIKTCDEGESAAFSSVCSSPFIVIRAAGSLGVDLVALRWDFSFPIEVKSSADDVLHFSRSQKLTDQACRMFDECTRSSVMPVYAFRLKGARGDPWRMFTLPIEVELKGRMGLLQRRVPKIEVTGNGNYVMRWPDGMKLSRFIEYMGMTSEGMG
jgi:Holliday junction resolvase